MSINSFHHTGALRACERPRAGPNGGNLERAQQIDRCRP
jgi:hypothetical protein